MIKDKPDYSGHTDICVKGCLDGVAVTVTDDSFDIDGEKLEEIRRELSWQGISEKSGMPYLLVPRQYLVLP